MDSIPTGGKGNFAQTSNPKTMITAINKKHQALVNRASKWLAKYNDAHLSSYISEDQSDKNIKRLRATAEKAFCNYLDLSAQLPIREKKNIEKFLW